MKTLLRLIFKTSGFGALALVLLLFEARASAQSPIDLIVIAERATPAANIAIPSPEHPVYYLAYDAGFIEAGEPIAGIQPPSSSEVGQGLRSALDVLKGFVFNATQAVSNSWESLQMSL